MYPAFVVLARRLKRLMNKTRRGFSLRSWTTDRLMGSHTTSRVNNSSRSLAGLIHPQAVRPLISARRVITIVPGSRATAFFLSREGVSSAASLYGRRLNASGYAVDTD